MVTLRLVTDDDRPVWPEAPHRRECVACFVDRMTRMHGCSHRLRWAVLWRDRRAPRATALERKLRSQGGWCDCEVLLNVFARRAWPAEWAQTAPVDEEPGPEAPACLGVRGGSTRACGRWVTPY